jgi:hypothetical protein
MVETKVEPKKPVILFNAVTNPTLFTDYRKKASCIVAFSLVSDGTMEQTSNV